MRRYVTQRLALAVPTVILVTFAVFAIVQLLPGDTAAYMAGPEGKPEDIERIRTEYHLDEPVPVQYVFWIGNVLRGDFGTSAALTRVPVRTLLGERLPATLELTILAMTLSLVVSIPVGLISAMRRDSIVDLASTTTSLAGISLPNFVLAYGLIFVFALKLGWLPPSGYVKLVDDPWQNLERMILPAITLAGSTVAAQSRLLRTATLETMSNDYVRTARAKGLGGRIIMSRHVLRNALIPFVTVAALQFGFLLSGGVIVETVFAIPGIGSLAVASILGRDIAVLQGVVLVAALFYVFITFSLDIVYAKLDPRIGYS
ncbi:MAG: ABC transporter permease [Vicinamibacterales bacterium]